MFKKFFARLKFKQEKNNGIILNFERKKLNSFLKCND